MGNGILPPKPNVLERARGARPLSELAGDMPALLSEAMSAPGGVRGRLALGMLESVGAISAVLQESGKLEPDKKAAVLEALCQEISAKPYKTSGELCFLAVNGMADDAQRAAEELGRRDAIPELLIVAKDSERAHVADTARSGIFSSEVFLDLMLGAYRSYCGSGFDGHFRDFLLNARPEGGMGGEKTAAATTIAKLISNMDGCVWWELKSDVSMVPLALKAVTLASEMGRADDAKELASLPLGRKDSQDLLRGLGATNGVDIHDLRALLEKTGCGKRLITTLDEWGTLKDELIADEYDALHAVLGEEMFIFSSEEEGLMLLLPQELRERLAPKMNENIELLFSPLLTEGEKEKLIGMNEAFAKVSMNVGLIKTPLPQPFKDAETFREHVDRVYKSWEQIYKKEDIEAFAANRIITTIIQGTAFQRGAGEAKLVLDAIESDTWNEAAKAAPDARAKNMREVFRRLRGYIAFHEMFGRRFGLDFYQSLRVKAFMEGRRILVGDGTGTGKTIVALGAKAALDKEVLKSGRKARVLVLASSTGTVAAWGQKKMNYYTGKFKFPDQKVFIIGGRRDLKDFDAKVAESDLVVLGYGKLTDPENNEYVKRLMAQDFDAIIIDECHNLKNFRSLRGRCARKLLDHFRDKRLLLLSATPLPNAIDDGIGMLLYALDPVRHCDADSYVYNNDPDKAMDIWMGQKWFVWNLLDIRGRNIRTERTQDVELNDEEVAEYFHCWKECSCMGMKMPKLQRLLIDEEYAARRGVHNLSKLRALDELVRKAVGKEGRKVVIWTPWVEGVVDGLVERYSEFGSVKIDGRTTDMNQRYEIAEAFKKSEKLDVLVVSKVADEAIDLSCGKKPVLLIRIVPPIKPQEEIQTAGRVDRRDQEGDVEIVTLVSKSKKLSRLMQDFATNGLAEIGLNPPRNFLAQTIDQDVLLLLKWKNRIVTKLFKAQRLSAKDASVWDVGSLSQAEGHLRSSVRPAAKNIPPFKRAIYLDHSFRNAGAEKVAEAMQGGIGKAYAHFYELGWSSSHSYHTLLKLKELIAEDHALSKDGPAKIADLGGGAGYTSRVLGNPTTIVDLNRHFLEKGKEVCEARGINNTYIEGDMRATGLPGESFDATVASYSLHHLAQEPGNRQVEEALLEMNRMLKKGGKAYITFPWSAGEDALMQFAKGVEDYGFSVMNESGVYVPEFMDGKNGHKILVLVIRKENPCYKAADASGWERFVIFSEKSRIRFAADHYKREKEKRVEEENEKIVKKFKKLHSVC